MRCVVNFDLVGLSGVAESDSLGAGAYQEEVFLRHFPWGLQRSYTPVIERHAS